MTKISSLKWILCGYQLTFIVKTKCTSKWFNKSNYFDGYSIKKRCLFNSFNVYLCENRIILRNDRYFLLQFNHWLELNVRDVSFYWCKLLLFVCMYLYRTRTTKSEHCFEYNCHSLLIPEFDVYKIAISPRRDPPLSSSSIDLDFITQH